MKKLILACLIVLGASSAFAAEGYKVVNKIKIGGTGGWDYLSVDPAAQRLYASHATLVHVVDLKTGKVVGTIDQLHGVHGIAIAPDLNKGFITNGQSNSVTVFDLKTLAKLGEPATGQNPDAVCYEPKTQRIITLNGKSNNASIIDAKNNEIIATIPLGGKPENCVTDGAGKIYNNIEDTAEVVEIDMAKPAVLRRASVAPCEEPSGIAMDVKNKKTFSVCGNKMMAVTDTATMKLVATPAIGAGPDGAGFDPGSGDAFSSNGGDGTMSIVKLVNGKYDAVETVPTEKSARTMTVDQVNHKVYMLAAEMGAVQGSTRPQALPDSFHVIVIGK